MQYSIDHNRLQQFGSLEFIARQVVEGFITGLHKSPFHGFSVEFAEHRQYNSGESIKHIDWKLYGRTDKLFVKRYEEETNLRCQVILDNSSSMYFPVKPDISIESPNKITWQMPGEEGPAKQISWFDRLFEGGIYLADKPKEYPMSGEDNGPTRALTMLLTGPPGSGESILALEMSYRWSLIKIDGRSSGLHCFYISTENSAQ